MSRKRARPLKSEPDGLVTIAELARKTGLTESAIRTYIARGKWVVNRHYYRRGRKVMMDPKACDQYWAEG